MSSLSEITIYPVKSCKGILLKEVSVGAHGAYMDRRWMIVDESYTFISQRTCPKLAMVHTALDERFLFLSVGLTDSLDVAKAESALQVHESIIRVDPGKQVPLPLSGDAPEFQDIFQWFNSDPLTIKALRGKVVLVEFWTYSCINCLRSLHYLKRFYNTYKDKNFVVIGVHTPEYPFERDTENVLQAIERYDIRYPVALDNDYSTWRAYKIRYWTPVSQ